MIGRAKLFLLLGLLVTLSQGCATIKVVTEWPYKHNRASPMPVQLTAGVKTKDGALYLRSRFSDGSVRYHRFMRRRIGGSVRRVLEEYRGPLPRLGIPIAITSPRGRIIGKHGWPAVPASIKAATIALTTIYRLETPRATGTLTSADAVLEATPAAVRIVKELQGPFTDPGAMF